MTNAITKDDIGKRVVAPVTNAEGETEYKVGDLSDLNSRYATVLMDGGGTVKVGKTKVELWVNPEPEDDEEDPEYEGMRIGAKYLSRYDKCTAASGKASLDNGDEAALNLRGVDLLSAYRIVAEALELPVKELMAAYAHLNPGHQRMCIGNRYRKHLKDLDKQNEE